MAPGSITVAAMTLDAANSGEKRWFNGMLGFSAVAAVSLLGMTAMHYWAKGELQDQMAAAGGNEAAIAAAHRFLEKIQLATLIGQGVLMIGCLGFLVTGGNWLIALKRRRAGRLG
jgi:hypothetical protein